MHWFLCQETSSFTSLLGLILQSCWVGPVLVLTFNTKTSMTPSVTGNVMSRVEFELFDPYLVRTSCYTFAWISADRWWVLLKVTSLLKLNKPQFPNLSSQGKNTSPWASGALCSTCPYLSVSVLCWGGPKLNRVYRCGQMNDERSGISL